MREDFERAMTFEQYLEEVEGDPHPWRDFYQRARVHEDLSERARELGARWHLLVLSEGWCGDGANTIPYLARLTEEVETLDLRILRRDAHPHIMDSHLTAGARAIPVVLILDEDFQEVGWWGPRPQPLQEVFYRELQRLPQRRRYPLLRRWYARDRGRTALEEILARIPVSV